MGTAEAMDNLSKAFRSFGDAIGKRDPFEADLHRDMIDVGHGHDPHNHIGDRVVADVLGVDLTGIGIGEPVFAAGFDFGGDPNNDAFAHFKDGGIVKLDNQSGVRVGDRVFMESVVNMEGGDDEDLSKDVYGGRVVEDDYEM